MDINAQEAEAPIVITPQSDTSAAIVFLIMALILLGYSIFKIVLGCIRLFNPKDSEWVAFEKFDRRIEKTVYSAVLEELAAGEEVLYATDYPLEAFKTAIATLPFGCGLILLIITGTILSMSANLGGFLFYLNLTFCILGYICALVYELVLSTWTTYNVTAITNKRALSIEAKTAGRFNSASRKVVSSSPLQNLILSKFDSKPFDETKTMGHLVYRDRSSNFEYSMGAIVWNPENIKLLVEQHQMNSNV